LIPKMATNIEKLSFGGHQKGRLLSSARTWGHKRSRLAGKIQNNISGYFTGFEVIKILWMHSNNSDQTWSLVHSIYGDLLSVKDPVSPEHRISEITGEN
jgi:hypothetical protein